MPMTPRERLLAAMTNQETDHVPCAIYFNRQLRQSGYDCSKLTDRTALSLALGVDPFVLLGMPPAWHPQITTRVQVTKPKHETYPLLQQEWQTPAGKLQMSVRMDAACAGWSKINWGDESASSLAEPLIEAPTDVDAFRYLFQPQTEVGFLAWQQHNTAAFAHAQQHHLPVIATYGQGLATLMFTMGATNAVYFAMDQPAAFEELAEIIHQAEMRNIELAARAGVDILKRFGGYEMCNFYNPEIFRRVVQPRLKKEVDRAHDLGLTIFYRVVTGMKPILADIADIGFDCIEGGEPHLSDCSLSEWYKTLHGKTASWTGISSPVLLGRGTPEEVRREVAASFDIFGREGFILGVTNSIRPHFKWENTLAMVDEWKKRR